MFGAVAGAGRPAALTDGGYGSVHEQQGREQQECPRIGHRHLNPAADTDEAAGRLRRAAAHGAACC